MNAVERSASTASVVAPGCEGARDELERYRVEGARSGLRVIGVRLAG